MSYSYVTKCHQAKTKICSINMEDSALSINGKDKLSSRKILDSSAGSSKEARKAAANKNGSKSGWKSFFRIFKKSKKPLNKSCPPELNQIEIKSEKNESEVYLHDIEDDLAMAISLPEEAKGREVQVSIELKAIGRQDCSGNETGLKVAEETQSKTTFSGNIKIPSDTTIEQVANMPLYFVNPEKSLSSKGELSNKVETVVKPLEDNLPLNVDKSIIVSNISLKVNLQKSVDWKCKEGQLDYKFISNGDKSLKSLRSTKTLNSSNTSLRSKTDDIVEEISQINIYNEHSKMIVKEILSHVMEKVETHNISTQYTSILDCVNKEIDVQKSLLISDASDSLSRISEEVDSSSESAYPCTTTATKQSSVNATASEGSMYYLKPPTNTPKHNLPPRYMIMYSKENERKNKTLPDDVKADIDKTLELLETAKNKLLNYLDNAIDLVDFKRDYKYKYTEMVSPGKIFEELKKNQIMPTRRSTKNLGDIDERFFLAKNGEQQSPLDEPLTVPKLNTIQNIYNQSEDLQEMKLKFCDIDELQIKFKLEDIDALKTKIEGDLMFNIDIETGCDPIVDPQSEAVFIEGIKCKNIEDTLKLNPTKLAEVNNLNSSIISDEQIQSKSNINEPTKSKCSCSLINAQYKTSTVCIISKHELNEDKLISNDASENVSNEQLHIINGSKRSSENAINSVQFLQHMHENLNNSESNKSLNNCDVLKNKSDEQFNIGKTSSEKLRISVQLTHQVNENPKSTEINGKTNSEVQLNIHESFDKTTNKLDEQLRIRNDSQINSESFKIATQPQHEEIIIQNIDTTGILKTSDVSNKSSESVKISVKFTHQVNENLSNTEINKPFNYDDTSNKLNNYNLSKTNLENFEQTVNSKQQINKNCYGIELDEQIKNNDALKNDSNKQLNITRDIKMNSDNVRISVQFTHQNNENLNKTESYQTFQTCDILKNKSEEQLNIGKTSSEKLRISVQLTHQLNGNRNSSEINEKINTEERLNSDDDPKINSDTLKINIQSKHNINENLNKPESDDNTNSGEPQENELNVLINKPNQSLNDSDDLQVEINKKLSDRYSANCETKHLSFDLIGDDINYMIHELLNESGKIKELVCENIIEDPKQSEPEDDGIVFSMDVNINVKGILNDILDRVFTSAKLDGDLCKTKKKTICVNYCLMNRENYTTEGFLNQLEYIEKNLQKLESKNRSQKDAKKVKNIQNKELSLDENKLLSGKHDLFEKNKPDIAHTSVDELRVKSENYVKEKPQKALITYRPQRYSSYPKISVRRLNSSKKHVWLRSEENLVQHLERGTHFLKNICTEICSSNYTINDEDNVINTENSNDVVESREMEVNLLDANINQIRYEDNSNVQVLENQNAALPNEISHNIQEKFKVECINNEINHNSNHHDLKIQEKISKGCTSMANQECRNLNNNINEEEINLMTFDDICDDIGGLRTESSSSSNDRIGFPEKNKIKTLGNDLNKKSSTSESINLRNCFENQNSENLRVSRTDIIIQTENLASENDILKKNRNSLDLYDDMRNTDPYGTWMYHDKKTINRSVGNNVEVEKWGNELIEIFLNQIDSDESRYSSDFITRSESTTSTCSLRLKYDHKTKDNFKENEFKEQFMNNSKIEDFVKEINGDIEIRGRSSEEIDTLNKDLLKDFADMKFVLNEIKSNDDTPEDMQNNEVAMKNIIDHDCIGRESNVKTFNNEEFKKEFEALMVNLSSNSLTSDSKELVVPMVIQENAEVLINEITSSTGSEINGMCDDVNNISNNVEANDFQNSNRAIFTRYSSKEDEVCMGTIKDALLNMHQEEVKYLTQEKYQMGLGSSKSMTGEQNITKPNQPDQTNNNEMNNKVESASSDITKDDAMCSKNMTNEQNIMKPVVAEQAHDKITNKLESSTIKHQEEVKYLTQEKYQMGENDDSIEKKPSKSMTGEQNITKPNQPDQTNDDAMNNTVEFTSNDITKDDAMCSKNMTNEQNIMKPEQAHDKINNKLESASNDIPEDNVVNPPKGLFLLKKAAKRLQGFETEQNVIDSSQEEIIEAMYDLTPVLTEKQSHYSHYSARRQREKQVQYSSSSSEEEVKLKVGPALNQTAAISQKASYTNDNCRKNGEREIVLDSNKIIDGINILSVKSQEFLKNLSRKSIRKSDSFISSTGTLAQSSSVYDADHEISLYALPSFRYEYESRQELNNEMEVCFIEQNAADNLRLNPRQDDDFAALQTPWICESAESVATTISLDSEDSLENKEFRHYKS